MNLPRGWELILVVVVIVLLFGAKRMPDAARSVGRSLRIFKAETKGLTDDNAASGADAVGGPPQSLPTAPDAGAPAPTEAKSPERTEG